ncbi:MAG: hypothetical protein ACOC0M_00470 [Halomonas sp.]
MTIDPEKLLDLARQRQGPAGVTLSWPTVLKIIEELRQLQAKALHLEALEEATLPCRFHDQRHEDCLTYSGRVPCEPRSDEAEVQAVVNAEGGQ